MWIIVAVVAGLAVAAFFITRNRATPAQPAPALQTVNQAACNAAGGHWNACGSACRSEPPGTPCIEVCVPYCECGGLAGFRSACGDYEPKGAADAMGVCK